MFGMTVYVISTCHNELYVGLTKDFDTRLASHKKGDKGSSSKNLRDYHTYKLVHKWLVPGYSLASRLERYLHTKTDAEILLIIAKNKYWNELLSFYARSIPMNAREAQIELGKPLSGNMYSKDIRDVALNPKVAKRKKDMYDD